MDGLIDVIKQSFIGGYATGAISVKTIFICLTFSTVVSVYIFIVYRGICKKTFYDRNFALSLIAIPIVTSAIILTIQSNIVVSLGMVGALSIVRFRTAIKDPMDLLFLFWAIAVGIICGAGFMLIAVVASCIITIAAIIFMMIPDFKSSMLLVINSDSYENESEIMETVRDDCTSMKVRARNLSLSNMNLAIEVKVKDQHELVTKLIKINGVSSASLVEHSGDIVG